MTKSLIGHCKELRLHSKQQNFKQMRNDIFQVGSFAQLYLPKLIGKCTAMLYPSPNWILEEIQREEDAFADVHSIICCVGNKQGQTHQSSILWPSCLPLVFHSPTLLCPQRLPCDLDDNKIWEYVSSYSRTLLVMYPKGPKTKMTTKNQDQFFLFFLCSL